MGGGGCVSLDVANGKIKEVKAQVGVGFGGKGTYTEKLAGSASANVLGGTIGEEQKDGTVGFGMSGELSYQLGVVGGKLEGKGGVASGLNDAHNAGLPKPENQTYLNGGANATVNTKGLGGVIKGSVEFTYKPVDSTLPHLKCVTANNVTSCYAE